MKKPIEPKPGTLFILRREVRFYYGKRYQERRLVEKGAVVMLLSRKKERRWRDFRFLDGEGKVIQWVKAGHFHLPSETFEERKRP